MENSFNYLIYIYIYIYIYTFFFKVSVWRLESGSLRYFVSCGGALLTGCDYVLHSSFGCVPPLDTSPLASGGRPPRLLPSSEGLGLSPDA